jgi:hypothetical protein
MLKAIKWIVFVLVILFTSVMVVNNNKMLETLTTQLNRVEKVAAKCVCKPVSKKKSP